MMIEFKRLQETSVFDDIHSWSGLMTESVIKRDNRPPTKWGYEYGVLYKGIEQVWKRTKNERYLSYIKTNIDTLIDIDGNIRGYKLEDYNIDYINNGKILFFLFRETGDPRYKNALFLLREQLKTHPRTAEGGFWHKKIYPHQMWLDGLYMGAPFLAEFIKTFGKTEDFGDVTNQFLLAERHLKDCKTGLFFHGWDESRQQSWADQKTGRSPNFWGRAMGWFVMSLVDVLDFLPEEHHDRGRIKAMLGGVVSAITKVQQDSTGVWCQVLDGQNREGNYLEASASCMFVYSIAKAVRKGYISGEYFQIAQKGFSVIINEFITVDNRGFVNLNNICQVAGLGTPPYQNAAFAYRDGSFRYYIGEPVVANDLKGIGAFILAAAEMESSAVHRGTKRFIHFNRSRLSE